MRKLFLTFLLTAVTLCVSAVPAKPGTKRMLTLTDGTTISAMLVGDEHGHFWKAENGKSYQMVGGSYQEVNPQNIMQKASLKRSQANSRRAKRMAPRKVGDVGGIIGKKKGLIILVNFSNVSFQEANDNALFQRIANEKNFSYGSFKGSMYDYFYAQSEGQFELTFDVVGPVPVSNQRTYYGSNDSDGNDVHPAEMVIEALHQVDDQVNFADYDWDGDKEVEQVYVVYAGKGEADGGAASTIWPHEWTLTAANYYGDGTGSQTLDGVKIDTYACGGELNGSGNVAGIGTMCHEFSHCLGYPDFYDTDYSGGQGMFSWDLMDNGSYNGNGYQPAGYTSYERWVAGWKEPVELETTQSISNMKPLQAAGSDAYIIYNKGNRDEYYLLENRQQTGWDEGLPGKGLLILHVDYNSSVWASNQPNDDPSHQRMTWIPADNEYQYTTYQGSKYYTEEGAKHDPFPYGKVNAFNKGTTPAATLFNNNSDGTKYLDVSVENITQNGDGTISFDFVGAGSGEEPTPEVTTLLYEGLSGYTSSGDGTAALAVSNANLDYNGWATLTKIYAGGTDNAQANGGCLKFGSGSASGSMTTGDIPMTGNGTLTFYLKKYGSDTGKLNVTVTGATADVTQFTPAADWTLCTVSLTNATGTVTVTLATSSKRAYVDEIKLVGNTDSGEEPTPDPETDYYKPADGKMGAALKTALCGIIYNRTEKSYDDLWEAFKTTDVDSNGKIWDMYSNVTSYTPVTSGSTYSEEGDCYNREHSWPQSWFGSKAPMYTDLHHIYPTDGFVNGKRSNYPFGEVNNPTYTSANAFSKLGPCSYNGYSGTVFEPDDEYKGDFARTYFYMVTCYEEKLSDWYTNYSSTDVVNVIDGSAYPGLKEWQLKMLMEWAKNDPVSEKETARNNAVYDIQKNRNPFIDYPGLQEYIWGICMDDAFSYDNYVEPVYTDEPSVDPDDDTPRYELVTDASTLAAGDKILIANIGDKATYVLSTTQNTNNRAATGNVTVNDDGTLTPGEAAQVITLEKEGSNFLFNVGGGYLYAASSSSNYLKTEATADDNAKATVAISSGSATITFQGTNTRNVIRFNPNNNSPIFSCYASNSTVGSLPQIYRLVTVTDITLANGEDNTAVLSSHNGKIVNATLANRTLYKDGSWNTLCLPFDVTIADSPLDGDNVQARELNAATSSFEGNTLTLNFTDVTTLKAGKPYLIKWDATGNNLVNPKFEKVTISSTQPTGITTADGNVEFLGTYAPAGLTAGTPANLFMGSGNTLHSPSTDGYSVKAFRAYFLVDLGNGLGKANVQIPAISQIVLNYDGGSELSIGGHDFKDLSAAEGVVYTLDGRRLCNAADFYRQVAQRTMPRGVYVIRPEGDINHSDKLKVVVK